jgi:hypothetical protein
VTPTEFSVYKYHDRDSDVYLISGRRGHHEAKREIRVSFLDLSIQDGDRIRKAKEEIEDDLELLEYGDELARREK